MLSKVPLLGWGGRRKNYFMKRIYTSLGMAALSAAGLQCVHAQQVDTSKPWSISSSLRGFYDDNINTAHSDKVHSFGVQMSPTIAFGMPLEGSQTDIAASYNYSHKWYDTAVNSNTGGNDHTEDQHTFMARLNHAFTERLIMSVQDSFVVGQEPDQLAVHNTAIANPQWVSGNNIRNYGSIAFDAQLTRQVGVEVGYANSLFDYADNSDFGNAALLNRLDNVVHLDGRWTIQPGTVGILGIQFREIDYTGNLPIQLIGYGPPPSFNPVYLYSDSRNVRMYYLYTGIEHTFTPDLTGSLLAGASYADYYNSPNGDTSYAPYVQGSLSYQYAKDSSLNVGVSVDQSATYESSYSAQNNSLTTDAETVLGYVSVRHRIAADLYVNASGQYQYSVFNGGTLNNDSQNLYTAGVNLEYRINRHVSADAGYSYDGLSSGGSNSGNEVPSYSRNRVYIGATVIY